MSFLLIEQKIDFKKRSPNTLKSYISKQVLREATLSVVLRMEILMYCCVCKVHPSPVQGHSDKCERWNTHLATYIQNNRYECLGCNICRSEKITVTFQKNLNLGYIPYHMAPDMAKGPPLSYSPIIQARGGRMEATTSVQMKDFAHCYEGLIRLRNASLHAFTEAKEWDKRRETKDIFIELMNFCNYHINIHSKLNVSDKTDF